MLFISEISEDDSAKFLKNQVTGRQVVLLNPYCNEILNSDLLDDKKGVLMLKRVKIWSGP